MAEATDIFQIPFILIAAPFVGGFLGVLAERLPQGAPVVFARSRCAGCRRPLHPLELIPIVSWCALRGRCRTGRAPIGWIAPGMEAGALLIAIWAVLAAPGWLAAPSAALGWALLTLAVIDARAMILPDLITLPLIPAGLAVAAWAPGGDVAAHLLGAALGGGLLWAVAETYRLWRGVEGLGLGDAKLFAAAGAWLGWAGLASVLLIAAAAALAAALGARMFAGAPALSLKTALPFGPFLAAGFWLTWLYGPLS